MDVFITKKFKYLGSYTFTTSEKTKIKEELENINL
tara:strand:- start:1028 stop:1132 length:105 start_codon:yes stop_codon:yes gene_type:complete